MNGTNGNGNGDKWTSRKYKSVWYLTWLFTGLLVIPRLITLLDCLFKIPCSIDIMPVDSYVTFMIAIWLGYSAANVTAKHKAFNEIPIGNTSSSSSTTTTIETSSDNDGDNGKSPEAK